MVIVVALSGKAPVPQVIEEPSGFQPEQGAKYMILVKEEAGSLFRLLQIVKKLVNAKCKFTVWETGDVEIGLDTGATQVW